MLRLRLGEAIRGSRERRNALAACGQCVPDGCERGWRRPKAGGSQVERSLPIRRRAARKDISCALLRP